MKKYLSIGAVAMAMLASGCSNDLVSDNSVVDNSGKEKILFAAGDGQQVATTRAGFTTETRIVARIVSDKRGGGSAKCVRTVMLGAAAGGNDYSSVSYLTGKVRYWDDAYGRNSILSVYAVAIPNKNTHEVAEEQVPYIDESEIKGADTWAPAYVGDDNDNIQWSVATTQTTTTLDEQDLTYSNNIQETGDNGVYTWSYTSPTGYPEFNPENAVKHEWDTGVVPSVEHHEDGRLYFTQDHVLLSALPTEATGHFDKGQMEFNHALSRVQVNLVKGDGYGTAPFSITSMQLLNQKNSGTFDIKNASWLSLGAPTTINMALWSSPATDKTATYEAQVLPGYEFADNDNNALQFTVDGNTYYITNRMLRTSFAGASATGLQMGKRYIFDISVAKQKIQNITATVVEWVTVDGSVVPVDNSHVSFTLYNPSGTACGIDNIKLYKYDQNLGSAYFDDSYPDAAAGALTFTGPATLTSNAGKYTTDWYYENNNTAYHLRSLNTTAANGATSLSSFTMTSVDDDATEYHWGAPMQSAATLQYNPTTGYTSSVYKGLVSTTSDVKITELQMMSRVYVKLATTETGDQVNLAGAKVYLKNYYNTASVDMRSGLVTPSTVITEPHELQYDEANTQYYFNVVPQSLKDASPSRVIGITIKTADDNNYFINDLTGITATSVGNTKDQHVSDKITRWFPGHKYTYTFKLKKTAIDNITATIQGWINVNGSDTNVSLEN